MSNQEEIKLFLNEESKNKYKITCTKCSCVILRQSEGCFSEIEVSMPSDLELSKLPFLIQLLLF